MYHIRDKFNSYEEYKAFYTAPLKDYDLSIDYIKSEDYVYPELHRWQWALSHLEKLKVSTVLDVGSWTGRFAVCLKNKGFAVECLEGNPDVVDYFRTVSDIPCHNLLFEDFVPKQKYDAITLFEVIEHVYDMERFLAKLEECTDGYLLLSTPSDTGCFADENDIHLWLANEQSIRETFKNWNILDLHVGDLIMLLAERKI